MENWLDKAISWISPNAGLRRLRARKLVQLTESLAYEGARSTRRQGGWNPTSSSGNSEISTYGTTLRNNARDLCRNNAYARRAKREWAKRVVGGGGITPRPQSGTEKTDKIIVEYWNEWAEVCCSDSRINFYAAEKLIVSSAFESGEVLVRLWDRKIEDKLPVPLQIQVIECDYLDGSKMQKLTNGYIIQGIEFDPIGRIRGYWIFNNHPGEVIAASIRPILQSAFVPSQYVLYHAEIDRPGDARAVTRFSSVINKLRDIDEYSDAEIIRKKTEACLAMFITQPEGAEGPTLGSAAVDATTGLKVEDLRPGMVAYGEPGVEAKFFAPEISGDYCAYKKTEIREVAAGLEIPYVVLDDNLEAVNYSSYRGGLLAFRDAIKDYRENYLIPQVLNPIYRRFVEKLAAMQKIDRPYYGVVWDPPPFDLLDRSAEAEADRGELQIGKKTWPQLVGEQGNDPKEQIAEIEKWKSRLDAAGVTFAKSTSESNKPAGGQLNADSETEERREGTRFH